MNKKLADKLNKSGFSLAEMLIAILIVLMVSSIVAAGVPAAARALTRIVDASNAHVLLTMTMTELRDELSTASANTIEVKTDEKGKPRIITYEAADGTNSLIKVVDTDDTPPEEVGIYIQQYIGYYDKDVEDPPDHPPRLLVSKAAANKNLHAVYDSLDYTNGVVTVNKLQIFKDTANTPIAEIENYQIRVISYTGN